MLLCRRPHYNSMRRDKIHHRAPLLSCLAKTRYASFLRCVWLWHRDASWAASFTCLFGSNHNHIYVDWSSEVLRSNQHYFFPQWIHLVCHVARLSSENPSQHIYMLRVQLPPMAARIARRLIGNYTASSIAVELAVFYIVLMNDADISSQTKVVAWCGILLQIILFAEKYQRPQLDLLSVKYGRAQ